MKQEPIKIKIPTCEEKITKIKVQINEYEIQIFPIICLLVCLLVGIDFFNFQRKIYIYISVLELLSPDAYLESNRTSMRERF